MSFVAFLCSEELSQDRFLSKTSHPHIRPLLLLDRFLQFSDQRGIYDYTSYKIPYAIAAAETLVRPFWHILLARSRAYEGSVMDGESQMISVDDIAHDNKALEQKAQQLTGTDVELDLNETIGQKIEINRSVFDNDGRRIRLSRQHY